MNSMEIDIVRRAFRKAFANGYGPPSYKRTAKTLQGEEKTKFTNQTIHKLVQFIPVFELIYGHQFAKALWGEDTQLGWEFECDNCLLPTMDWLKAWEFHLQAMVIANDPIKYLGENI